jgi:hypothetical protein
VSSRGLIASSFSLVTDPGEEPVPWAELAYPVGTAPQTSPSGASTKTSTA